MIKSFQGPFSYDYDTINNWNSSAIGVYYCGVAIPNNLSPFYIGRAVSEGGIRTRLLQHLGETKWRDVTDFGFRICDTTAEVESLEASEIKRCQPKYNTHGK